MTNVNELGANLDIIKTESITEIGSYLTVMVNGSRNHITIGMTVHATENGMASERNRIQTGV